MPDHGAVSGDAGKSRVFFALWPEPVLSTRLHAESMRLHRLVGGRPTRPETLHLTLVFVGEVANSRLEDLGAAAGAVKCPPFEMLFDRETCWRHNHIAHLGASRPPAALFNLVGQLSANLKAAEIAFDVRPFSPHITLVRKADCARFAPEGKENPAREPVRWSARDFVLVKSSLHAKGACYERLGRWPLL
jgi:2'-5' RNA ligase